MSTKETIEALLQELQKYGVAQPLKSLNIFSGGEIITGIDGEIDGEKYQVSIYEKDSNFPCNSAHFSCNISNKNLSEAQISAWNADNRFSKIYHQKIQASVLLTLDAFLPDNTPATYQCAARMWAATLEEIR